MTNIRYTSKVDRVFFISYIVVVIALIGAFVAEGLTGDPQPMDVLVMVIVCVACIVLFSSFLFSIVYEFREHYLYVRAGVLFTKVYYDQIEGVRYIDNWLDVGSGFNLLASKKALAIMAQNILLGEVKISPTDREAFIAELDRRRKQAHALRK